MPGLLINLDVPDIERATAFYTAAFSLTVGRRFDADFVELLGAPVPLYLLRKDAGTSPVPGALAKRSYDRHWTPVHVDLVVDDIDAAVALAIAAGAIVEAPVCDAPYGRLALLADPFGHGFCLLQLTASGYDALLPGTGS